MYREIKEKRGREGGREREILSFYSLFTGFSLNFVLATPFL